MATANRVQLQDIRQAALLEENDDDGENNDYDDVPDMVIDNDDSGDEDDEDNNIHAAHPCQCQEIIDAQPVEHQHQRPLHHPGPGDFDDNNQEIPRFLGEDKQGPNYVNIKQRLKENFVENGGQERSFHYRAEEISALDCFQLFFSVIVLNTFVVATNVFGATYFRNTWKNVSKQFKAFLAIIVCLGDINFPRREVAFDKESGLVCTFIYTLMNEHRF